MVGTQKLQSKASGSICQLCWIALHDLETITWHLWTSVSTPDRWLILYCLLQSEILCFYNPDLRYPPENYRAREYIHKIYVYVYFQTVKIPLNTFIQDLYSHETLEMSVCNETFSPLIKPGYVE